MIVLLKTLQVILALAILVLIHELGHFAFAKMFKIKVEKFYLFFDVGGFALLRFKPKNSDTEYGIGWLPLGGYCKIAGMVDESMDTEALKSEPQPWEFRSHPAWQRLLVMIGGVLFNFILAILLYIGVMAVSGESYFNNEGNAVYVNDLAYDMGFRNGDQILAFDDYVPEDFNMLQADLARHTARKAVVLRGADTVNIYIDQNMLGEVISSPGMFSLAVPFVIDTIPPASLNYGSGLASGDRIVAVDGTEVEFVQDARPLLEEHRNGLVDVTVLSEGDTVAMTLQVDSLGLLGVYNRMPAYTMRNYNVIQAIPAGCRYTFSTIGGYLRDLKLVFTPKTKAYKQVGSFIAIGQAFPSKWDWFRFINLLALLSIMLGVMNLLPIPALDGGHVVFTLYEIITRHKPSDKFLEGAQIVGMVLLVLIMILAFGNDIMRLFSK